MGGDVNESDLQVTFKFRIFNIFTQGSRFDASLWLMELPCLNKDYLT